MTDEKRVKIYIGGIDWDANEDDVKHLVDETGVQVHEFIFPQSKKGYASAGFAFAVVNEGDAEEFIRQLDGHSFMERVLRCEVAQNQQGQPRRDRFFG
jgi:RNA recognition motif-containing protein